MSDLIRQYRYVTFEKEAASENEETYTVLTNAADKRRCIGAIKWYSKQSTFCFYPIGGVVLPAKCLNEIAEFIGEAMDAYADAVILEGKT